jgi:hypothetical protein
VRGYPTPGRRIAASALLLVLALLLAGCRGDERFPIAGLNLPRQAMEVEIPAELQAGLAAAAVAKGHDVWTVGFNCSLSWPRVRAHFDRELERAGYSRNHPSAADMQLATGLGLPNADSVVAVYSAPGKPYTVRLSYTEIMFDAEASQQISGFIPEYILHIEATASAGTGPPPGSE